MTGRAAGSGAARILMVDDRSENLLALEAILSGLGHELIRAGSGEEALKRLLVEDVALILLDVQMPGMDGFETAAHIKQRERTRSIPIVFLTAIDGEAHQAFRGYAAGAVDYLSKPFDPWVLRAKVGVFIELHERRQELAAQADQMRAELASFSSGEVHRLLELAVSATRAAERAADDAGDESVRATVGAASRALTSLVAALPSTGGRL